MQAVYSDTTQFVQQEPILLPRSGVKAHCKWNRTERDTIQLDIAQLIQPFNAIHTTLITHDMLSSEAQVLLSKSFKYMCALPDENDHHQLDNCFHELIDEPLNAAILIQNIDRHHCLKSYVMDSLKRFNSLSDVMHSLSLCLDLQATDAEPFLDIVDQINRYTLLVCTIESLSFDSQRFLSNLIVKNDLPIPLAFYTANEFKINFNNLTEPLCLTRDRLMLLMGSTSAVGLGKTSLIPYIFHDKRNDSLNTDGNRDVRSSCVDTIFAKLENKSSYAVFDVHGTINTLNEDLITAIQHYCSIQVICVTEADLHHNDFLTSTMNYSEEIRTKPTIVVIFDSNYNNKDYSSTEIIYQFQSRFQNESWPNVVFMTAPVLQSLQTNSAFTAVRRAQRLRQSFANSLHTLQTNIERQPICGSILIVQAYYLAIKAGTNVCPVPLCNMTILSQLDTLFNQLNDKTQNLFLVTPVSYLDGAILKYEKELSGQWHEPSSNIQAQLEELRQEYQKIDRIPTYTDFFINLITKRPYIELLITEKYLEQWRARFEPVLMDKMRSLKNGAMSCLSRINPFSTSVPYKAHFFPGVLS